jgi:hypothetical protein
MNVEEVAKVYVSKAGFATQLRALACTPSIPAVSRGGG